MRCWMPAPRNSPRRLLAGSSANDRVDQAVQRAAVSTGTTVGRDWYLVAVGRKMRLRVPAGLSFEVPRQVALSRSSLRAPRADRICLLGFRPHGPSDSRTDCRRGEVEGLHLSDSGPRVTILDDGGAVHRAPTSGPAALLSNRGTSSRGGAWAPSPPWAMGCVSSGSPRRCMPEVAPPAMER